MVDSIMAFSFEFNLYMKKFPRFSHKEKTNQPYATTKKKHGIVFFSKERRTIEHDNVNLQ